MGRREDFRRELVVRNTLFQRGRLRLWLFAEPECRIRIQKEKRQYINQYFANGESSPPGPWRLKNVTVTDATPQQPKKKSIPLFPTLMLPRTSQLSLPHCMICPPSPLQNIHMWCSGLFESVNPHTLLTEHWRAEDLWTCLGPSGQHLVVCLPRPIKDSRTSPVVSRGWSRPRAREVPTRDWAHTPPPAAPPPAAAADCSSP